MRKYYCKVKWFFVKILGIHSVNVEEVIFKYQLNRICERIKLEQLDVGSMNAIHTIVRALSYSYVTHAKVIEFTKDIQHHIYDDDSRARG